MFGSKVCPKCKNKSPAPWRSAIFLLDGEVVWTCKLIRTSERLETPKRPSTFSANVCFIVDEENNIKNKATFETPTEYKAGCKTFWRFQSSEVGCGCIACDGEHSAAAAMRRKMEGLW